LPAGDIKTQYAADVQLTITLASLASSTSLTVGRESGSVDNTTNKYTGYFLSGKITTGTSPTTAKSIEIWVVPVSNDTPTWPDVFDGTDSGETITSREILASCARLAHVIATDATSDRPYPFHAGNIARLFGGAMPDRFVVFVVHDTAVNLNSTGGNHEITVQGFYENVAAS
jgi:hypothetical protein